MEEAVQSPVISQLFTRGRHRNPRVLLLLQNMFPKGKFNTNISQNALYKVLFRSPGDRKQIDIMAEQTFAKDRSNFMKAYNEETAKPFSYIILDNHPRTTSDRQVVADVFGQCKSYPHISSQSGKFKVSDTMLPKVNEQPKLTVKRKVELPFPAAKRSSKSSVKRKVKSYNKSAKNQKKPVVKREQVKTSKKQPTSKARKSTQRGVYPT